MILSLILAAAAVLSFEEGERSDAYDAMLGCAAFHTIEATRVQGVAAESQQAVAYDFAQTALRLAPNGTVETANVDLEKKLAEFRE